MRNIILVIALFIGGSTFAQFSLSGGASFLKGFRKDTKPWFGFHVSGEIPRDDQVSFFLRYSYYFKQKSRDSSSALLYPIDPSNPVPLNIGVRTSMDYHIIEGGTRYYIGDGFDFGWSAYGGTNFMLVFNSVKTAYNAFDKNVYQVDKNNSRDGLIFGFGAGLSGGVKYTAPIYGTFYLDAGLNYMLFAQKNNATVSSDLFSSLIFSLNIGYRRDLIL